VQPDTQEILDLLPDLVLMVDADGTITGVNAAFRRALQRNGDSLIGHSLYDLIDTPAEPAMKYLRRCSTARQPLPSTLAFRLLDGGRLECRCDGSRTMFSGGAPGPIFIRCSPKDEAISSFRLLHEEVAALTREIAARHADEQALRQTEEQFRTLADSIPQLAWTANPNGRAFWFNRRWFEYTGMTLADMEGRRWRSLHEPETLRRALERWRVSIVTGEPFEMIFPLKGADGVFRPFLTRIVPVRDQEGRIARWFGTATDITDQRATEERLRQLSETLERRVEERTRQLTETNERLIAESSERRKLEQALYQAQKMEAVGQLTGGVAHDFNNLLTVVLGALERLELELGGGRLGRLVQSAKRAASRGATLTAQLLAFSRKQLLMPQRTNLNELIGGMSELLRGTLGSKIQVREALAAGAWPVFCDPNQLQSVLLNLALNARDAMSDGGVLTVETVNVEIGADTAARQGEAVAPGDYVLLAVTDTGTGIPPEVIDRIFEPFFSTKEVGKGSGLGLSQVYGFVAQSGGHVRVDSKPGVGTTVELYLPRSPDHESDSVVASAKTVGPGLSGQTVLVLEDDPDVRDFVVEILQGLGYHVLEAADGRAALRLLREERGSVDLLFTDVVMPGANGFEIAKEALSLRPKLKVLFTSGYTGNALPQDRPLQARIIQKPYRPIDLAREVQQILEPHIS
jgi:PAS domain S-box-containing protein